MNKEEIKQEQNKGLIARILGGTPTILQKVFFILMAFSLILWPLGCYVSIFFFDAPVRSYVDKICRYGMLITIYLYPIYLFPLLRFMFQLSKEEFENWLSTKRWDQYIKNHHRSCFKGRISICQDGISY